MTRREWLAKNPPPAPAGPLLDRAIALEAEGKTQEAATVRTQAAAAPAKCPLHPAAILYRHQNRQEDLYVCRQGPHFLLWTVPAAGGRPQLVPLTKLDLPELDAPMPGV